MATVPVPKGEADEAIGQRLRYERRAKGVWLRDLARELGVSVNTIRWHEAGARLMRLDLVVRAAQVIGIHPAKLITDEPTQPEPAPVAAEPEPTPVEPEPAEAAPLESQAS